MSINPGLIVVIVSVLIFYLRLIILQRQRAKQLPKRTVQGKAKTGKGNQPEAASQVPYTIISNKILDRAIGAFGLILVLLGLSLYAGFLPFSGIQPYWWVPTALGIISFSWAFRL